MKPKLGLPGKVVAAVLFAVIMLNAALASALWSASVSVGVRISTASQPAQLPVFRVGKSKATFVGGTGPFPTIAQIKSERIWLDFGVVAQGNSDNSNEILLVDNPGSASYALNTSLTPEIRGLFSSVQLLPAAVSPGGTATLAMKLDTHGVAIGSYEGTLTVSDLFGTFTRDIPVSVKVVAPSDEKATRDEAEVTDGSGPSAGAPRVRTTPVTPAPKATKPRTTPVPDPAAEPKPKPEPKPEPEPVPEPAPEPEPVPTPDSPPSLP